ncbi:MAG: hypothetical protein PHY16_00480 [Methylobacter sp.]|nr:hypothetical protein [Methylobacter sp.]
MAKGSIMLQIEVEQIIQAEVSDAPSILVLALDDLDGDRTTVREIATEKNQFFYGRDIEGASGFAWLDFSSESAFTQMILVGGGNPPVILHAPSHVSSPPLNGYTIAVLRIQDFGFSSPSGDFRFVLGRRVGSHAYLDEVLPG